MAKFVFKMQNILNLKLKVENQQKIEYGLANAKLKEEEDKLRQLMVRQAQYEERARELVNGRINIKDIKSCKQAIDAMKSAVRTQMIQVHVAQKNVDLARDRLNETMMERKTYEKLREHAFEDFKQELAYEENREIDQLVSYNFHKE